MKQTTIRITWLLILAGILAWLAWRTVAPFGTITYQTDFSGHDYFIGTPTPSERLEDPAARPLVATGEPLYISVYAPRPFNRATLALDYETEAPVIEIGLRRDQTVWNYERQPLRVETLDRLMESENTLRSDDTMLWQRESTFSSIDDFLNNLPGSESVAVYNYDLRYPFRLDGYQPSAAPRTLNLGARGAYVLHAYSNGETIDMEFFVRDLNANKDSDPISVTAYRDGQAVATTELADDGGEADAPSSERSLRLRTAPLDPGAYRIEFKANDDIITERIATPQSRLSFVNRLWLAAADRRDFSLYTDSEAIQVQTSNPASLQSVSFDGRPLEITETYKQFSSATGGYARRVKSLIFERDDVILAGDGAFAFAPDELFNPSVRQLRPQDGLEGINYVIARYEPAQGKAVFDLRGAYRENGAYSFMIAAPGLESTPDGLRIRSLSIRFEGDTVFGLMRALMAKIWSH